MTSPKELRSLLKLLRENGVLTYKSADLQISFAPDSHLLSGKKTKEVVQEENGDTWSQFPTGTLTPEQLMFYSSGGDPSEDPENEEAIPQ